MDVIGSEASRFRFLLDSQNLAPEDKRAVPGYYNYEIRCLLDERTCAVTRSLKTLSELLNKQYQKKKRWFSLMNMMFHLINHFTRILSGNGFFDAYFVWQCLKTNDALQFAVLTGCLRVSKESIFTGLNNFKILSITDSRFDEQFGFTDMGKTAS